MTNATLVSTARLAIMAIDESPDIASAARELINYRALDCLELDGAPKNWGGKKLTSSNLDVAYFEDTIERARQLFSKVKDPEAWHLLTMREKIQWVARLNLAARALVQYPSAADTLLAASIDLGSHCTENNPEMAWENLRKSSPNWWFAGDSSEAIKVANEGREIISLQAYAIKDRS